MNQDQILALAKAGSVGGIAVGMCFLLFRDFIRRRFLSQLTRRQSFILLFTLLAFSWSIAIAGVAAWVRVEGKQTLDYEPASENTKHYLAQFLSASQWDGGEHWGPIMFDATGTSATFANTPGKASGTISLLGSQGYGFVFKWQQADGKEGLLLAFVRQDGTTIQIRWGAQMVLESEWKKIKEPNEALERSRLPVMIGAISVLRTGTDRARQPARSI